MSTSSLTSVAIRHGGVSGSDVLPLGGVSLQDEQHESQRYRLLLVGNDCISKDVGAKLRRAGYSLVKLDDVPAGIEAASAVRFDYAVIDADGMGPNDLVNAREAFVQRGLRALAVMRCEHGAARPDPGESTAVWQHLVKPVAFEALVGALRASSSYT